MRGVSVGDRVRLVVDYPMKGCPEQGSILEVAEVDGRSVSVRWTDGLLRLGPGHFELMPEEVPLDALDWV